jgi:hypothetical protein
MIYKTAPKQARTRLGQQPKCARSGESRTRDWRVVQGCEVDHVERARSPLVCSRPAPATPVAAPSTTTVAPTADGHSPGRWCQVRSVWRTASDRPPHASFPDNYGPWTHPWRTHSSPWSAPSQRATWHRRRRPTPTASPASSTRFRSAANVSDVRDGYHATANDGDQAWEGGNGSWAADLTLEGLGRECAL